jgi:hypothetical protein
LLTCLAGWWMGKGKALGTEPHSAAAPPLPARVRLVQLYACEGMRGPVWRTISRYEAAGRLLSVQEIPPG